MHCHDDAAPPVLFVKREGHVRVGSSNVGDKSVKNTHSTRSEGSEGLDCERRELVALPLVDICILINLLSLGI
jgi:hypothetical protein